MVYGLVCPGAAPVSGPVNVDVESSDEDRGDAEAEALAGLEADVDAAALLGAVFVSFVLDTGIATGSGAGPLGESVCNPDVDARGSATGEGDVGVPSFASRPAVHFPCNSRQSAANTKNTHTYAHAPVDFATS
jgi:hypothetical protein